MRVIPRATALPLLVLLLAGCGGGGGSTGSGKAAYLAQAEAICTRANAAVKAVAGPTGATDFAPYVRKIVTLAETTTAQIAGLTPPKGDVADLQAKVIAPLQSQLRDGQRFADDVEAATVKKDTAALLRLAGSAPTKARADLAYMRSYGFKACVDVADTSS